MRCHAAKHRGLSSFWNPTGRIWKPDSRAAFKSTEWTRCKRFVWRNRWARFRTDCWLWGGGPADWGGEGGAIGLSPEVENPIETAIEAILKQLKDEPALAPR